LQRQLFAHLSQYREWFAAQDEWARAQVLANPGDPIWRHVGYIFAQFDGLVRGFQDQHGNGLDVFAFQVLNGVGDLLDLRNVVEPHTRINWDKLSPEEVKRLVSLNGHCSALVKVTPGYEDMFMAHSAWYVYSSMTRIFKHYHLQINDPGTAAHKFSFSSYPGYLESLDDFYIMDSGLVMLETSNGVFNMTLYDFVVPQSLLAWQRVRVANTVSHTGADWCNVISTANSGTYNNQYMVINMNQFEPQTALHDGALWVVEQIPTLVECADKTDVLRTGHWPSYNVPFFESVYNLSGMLPVFFGLCDLV
jgi:hypothetical protein